MWSDFFFFSTTNQTAVLDSLKSLMTGWKEVGRELHQSSSEKMTGVADTSWDIRRRTVEMRWSWNEAGFWVEGEVSQYGQGFFQEWHRGFWHSLLRLFHSQKCVVVWRKGFDLISMSIVSALVSFICSLFSAIEVLFVLKKSTSQHKRSFRLSGFVLLERSVSSAKVMVVQIMALSKCLGV